MDELERGPVYTIGDVVYYRASSLGGCVRMLALARQGFDPLPATGQIAEVFKAGRDAEQQVWAKGIVQGRAQEYVELPISSTIRVAGHLDCWEPERVYEIKSQSEGEWGDIEKSSLWYRYKFQISVYMHATGLPLTVVRVRRNKDGSISDEERQDYEAGRAPVSLAEIRQKIFRVELLARRDLSGDGCEKVEYPCPFYYTHVRDGEERGEDVREEVGDPEAVVLARQYQNAKLVATAANARVDASRKALLAYMGERKRLGLSDGTLLTQYQVAEKQVSYTRRGYWALRVTRKEKDVSGVDTETGEDTGGGGGEQREE